MTIKELTSYLENLAPPFYQESYDNSGLLTGSMNTDITAALISLDCTESVIEEAIRRNCNLVIAHHPIIFKGLKSLTGKNYIERTIIKAIKNDIAIYAIHTNLDNVTGGVNFKIASLLDLQKTRILAPKSQVIQKLTVFTPLSNSGVLLDALYAAGAGAIGNYDRCSFRSEGKGTFRANEHANPTIGSSGIYEEIEECKIEVIFPSYLKTQVLAGMRKGHVYEEIAYHLSTLENVDTTVGSGAIGELREAMPVQDFLQYLKEKMSLKLIKHTAITTSEIKTVALCGGSGGFLLPQAIGSNADIFITADYKYHEYFDADNKIIIADIGHYESEQYTKELLRDEILKKFTNFASYLSEVNTNPVNYYF